MITIDANYYNHIINIREGGVNGSNLFIQLIGISIYNAYVLWN